MERRQFLLGSGLAAVSAAGVIGSGAFSGVVSKRTAKIAVAHDQEAYLGLIRGKGANRSFVDYDQDGHLRLRLDRKNPTEGSGRGVNSDSMSWFDGLFRICNQGKETAKIYILKHGDKPHNVTFYHGSKSHGYEVIHGQSLDVSECLKVGLFTNTKGIASETMLLDKVLIVAIAKGAQKKEMKPEALLDSVGLSDKQSKRWVLNGT